MLRKVCGLSVLFCLAMLVPLHAAEVRYVKSPNTALNVRRGPGMEHSVIVRLPHGTEVLLRERWGLWYRIVLADNKTEGWALQRYLVTEPPADSEAHEDMSLKEERRRFDRLKRKGVIRIRRRGGPGVFRITINPLVWRRLTPRQQSNFLQRAHRLLEATVVEMRNQRNGALLARLTATGNFESYDEPRREQTVDFVPRPQTGQKRQ